VSSQLPVVHGADQLLFTVVECVLMSNIERL
jgi:hypothetical protein